MKNVFHILTILSVVACTAPSDSAEEKWQNDEPCPDCQETNEGGISDVEGVDGTALVVLGTCQDAGSPQINCQDDCCADLHENPDPSRKIVSLGLIDPENKLKYIFEATPHFPEQLYNLERHADFGGDDYPDGIFLTHAHIGHYTGLMYLGKESMDAKEVPVFAMPRMKEFIQDNGPWNLLVERKNILLKGINDQFQIKPSSNLTVIPFLVPHRDEFSETVGYRIEGPNKAALFIPDIDKWDKWDKSIIDLIHSVDYAFIDGTFYDAEEIDNRDVSEIPHPFVFETMNLMKDESAEFKEKVIFIHFNHTNPLLDENSSQHQAVLNAGFKVAKMGQVYRL